MTHKSETTLGRTKLVYSERGQLISQELPADSYNRPTPEIPTRPQPPTPKTAEQLMDDLDANQIELNAALDHFQTWQHKDEFASEKRELKMYLAEHEARVREAREKLNELEAADSPHTKLLKSVAAIEIKTSHLARETQFSAADKVAVSQYDQPYNQLTRETQKEIMRRTTINSLQHISANSFHGFGRLELAQRTLDGAKMCADKIRQALTAIGEVIASK